MAMYRQGVLCALLAMSSCSTGAAFNAAPMRASGVPFIGARGGAVGAWSLAQKRESPGRARFAGAARLRMQDDMDEPSWPSDSSGAVASPPMPSEAALYQCPQCKSDITLDAGSCANCGAPVARKKSFVDLTPESTSKKVKDESFTAQASSNPFFTVALSQIGAQLSGQPLRQELFRTPVVSYLYERGWRESFAQAGFPGIEKEYELAMDFFKAAQGKTVMDLSCGSGLMVRRLANSNFFGKVVAGKNPQNSTSCST
jgi:hypothetical protein